MKLSSTEKTEQEELRDALLEAYPSYDDLKAMVYFKLGKNLEEISGPEKLETVILRILLWSKSNGKWDDLIKGAYDSNPGNPKLKIIYQNRFLFPTKTPNILSDDQWKEILLILIEIDLDLLQETCQATLANIKNIEEKVPQILSIKNLDIKNLNTLREILLELYPYRKDNIPTILEFVERLINRNATVKDKLKKWLDKIVAEKNIVLPIYTEPKPSSITADSYLLIKIEKISKGFTLQSELIPNYENDSKPYDHVPIELNEIGLVNRSESDLRHDICGLIKSAKIMLVRKYGYTKYDLTVELFLPIEYLGSEFDLEKIAAAGNRLSPIGCQYRFAVRSLDRYLINEYSGWGDYLRFFEKRWEIYQQIHREEVTDIVIQSRFHYIDTSELSTGWDKNENLSVNLTGGLTQTEDKKKFFEEILISGVPFSLWNRCSHLDCNDVKQVFNSLMTLDSLQDLSNLFEKVLCLRREAHRKGEKAPDYLGYHLGFLCDRPDRVPLSLKPENQSFVPTN
jgi:hypothetical protein